MLVEYLVRECEEFKQKCQDERDEFKSLYKNDSEAMEKRVEETEFKFVALNEAMVNAQQAEFKARQSEERHK